MGIEEVEELKRRRTRNDAWVVGMFDRFGLGHEVSGMQEIG